MSGDARVEPDPAPRRDVALGRDFRVWTIALCGLVLVEQTLQLEVELRVDAVLFFLLLALGLVILVAHGAVALAGVNRALNDAKDKRPPSGSVPIPRPSPLRRGLVCLALGTAPWLVLGVSRASSLPGLGYLLLHHREIELAVAAPGSDVDGFLAHRRDDGDVEILLGFHGLMDPYLLVHDVRLDLEERDFQARHLVGPWYLHCGD